MPHKLSLQPKYGPHSLFAGEDKTLPATIIGDNNVLCDGAEIFAGSVLGNNNFIGNHASIREFVQIGNDCMIGRNVTIECHTTIGNFVVIQTGAHITGDMLIEDHVFIGPEACTMNDKYMGARDIKMEGPIFREGCHVGANSTILSGVEIGKGAVVGAGRVVTKNVPAGETWVGNPAKRLERANYLEVGTAYGPDFEVGDLVVKDQSCYVNGYRKRTNEKGPMFIVMDNYDVRSHTVKEGNRIALRYKEGT